MVYRAFVNLFHSISCLIFSILALYSSSNVLFRKKLLKNSASLSPTLVTYFVFIFIWAILTLIHCVYLISNWNPTNAVYNAYILYFTGFGPSISLTANSIAESFLCVERAVSLLFPIKYSEKKRHRFAWATALGLISTTVLSFFINGYHHVYPGSGETFCQNFACLIGNFYLFYIKIGLNVINIFFAIILSILIRRNLNSSNKNTKAINRMMATLISLTTSIELIPFFAGQVFLLVSVNVSSRRRKSFHDFQFL